MDWKKSHDQTHWLFPSIFQFYLHDMVVLQGKKTELSSIVQWVYLGFCQNIVLVSTKTIASLIMGNWAL